MDNFNKRLTILNKNSMKALLNDIGLTDKNKNILYLKYVDNLSFKEISATEMFKNYDTSTLTVMAWKARKELENIIEQQYTLLNDELKNIINALKNLNI